MDRARVVGYDPFAAGSKQRTHEIFARLREATGLHHHRMPDGEIARQEANYLVARPTHEFWSVLRYGDCADILQDSTAYSCLEGPGPERMVPLSPDGMLLVADDPAHRRQRQIANKAFLPRAVERCRPAAQAVVDALIDAVVPLGRADVMDDIATPLTVAMITDLFGVGRDRCADITRWGRATIGAMGGDPVAVSAATVSLLELFAFLAEKISERRDLVNRGEPLPDDALSALITAEHEGASFSDEEICMAANQFLSAGFETTATAIGNAIYLLCTHPEQRVALERDWSLLDHAVEEVLRFESPVEGSFRTTKCPVVIAGEEIPKASKVRIVYASANRDETRFEHASEFRLDRSLAELRGHLAFGHGTHACLGAALARMELGIAVETLLRRLPGLTLDSERAPERATSYMVNGFTHVPIRWQPHLARAPELGSERETVS